jgi:hypothetical protein
MALLSKPGQLTGTTAVGASRMLDSWIIWKAECHSNVLHYQQFLEQVAHLVGLPSSSRKVSRQPLPQGGATAQGPSCSDVSQFAAGMKKGDPPASQK